MMKKPFALLFFAFSVLASHAQVGIGTATPHASAQLEVNAPDKGLLIPRVTSATRPASPATGLLIYQTDAPAGFYFYNGGAWKKLEVTGDSWSINGNSGATSTAFVGNIDNYPLTFKVNNNIAGYVYASDGASTLLGYQAGATLAGLYNTAVGYQSQYNNTGSGNTSLGYRSLYFNTSGHDNTAIGDETLYNNSIGWYNTAIGAGALRSNTNGTSNLAIGYNALASNTVSATNVAIGNYALFSNTSNGNVAVGHSALTNNQQGANNVAQGLEALYSNQNGNSNTAIGVQALYANQSGYHNTALGGEAMYNNSSGYFNTAIGSMAMQANRTGDNNTAIGYDAGAASATALSNTIAIGSGARVTASYTAVIGNISMTSIGGYAPWTNLSDARFKINIQDEAHGLDFILQLRPITYNLDIRKLDRFLYGDKPDSALNTASAKAGIAQKEKILYSGFSAQQVEAAAEKVGYRFSGIHTPAGEHDHYTLEYSTFVVPLVKAVQEQQQQIEALQQMVKELSEKVQQTKASTTVK